jgi:glucosylceramidase
VPQGSVRIASNISGDFVNVAFRTPQGKKVLIVINNGKNKSSFNISDKGKAVAYELGAGAVASFVW